MARVSNFFYDFCCVKDLRKILVGTVCSPVMYGLEVHTLSIYIYNSGSNRIAGVKGILKSNLPMGPGSASPVVSRRI